MQEASEREVRVIRIVVRTFLGVMVAALLVYPADWAVWRVRVLFGGGMGTVQVSRFTVAELKGNKEDYYPDGTDTVACSRSLFPQTGAGACWWRRRHPEVIERY
ncbi:MAG TPA: hypothetical protein VIJ65_02565 [Acidobacteriaceae bacterium]